jgi:hypothetical protein
MTPLRLTVKGEDLVPRESAITQKTKNLIVISDFRRDVDEICALLDITQRRVVTHYRRFGTSS